MKKQIMIVSILAVVILIGVSFSSVVGYNKVTSNVKESPLFKIRTSRAIDEDSKDIACDYVGKGEVTNIYLPKGNDRTDSVDTLINVIKRMDDKSLQRFAYFIKYRLQQTDSTPDFDSKDIFQSLKQLRDNPDSVKLNTEKESFDTLVLTMSACDTCPSIDSHTPFYCLLYYLLLYALLIRAIIGEYLTINPFACS
ncbi:hypothetical protein MBGDF03_00363 [Thermoplasmatales archaeon SCGC AB-540-F20]|nr:hypothetical protein MBGDF03_00363 [Thermoplasmatales archaeon SCGC AB-540-F20]